MRTTIPQLRHAPPGQRELSHALPGFEHVNRYWDRVHNAVAAKILPGEYYVTTNEEIVVTVLGSCVSACVRDKLFRVGGMNHFMLPFNAGEDVDTSSTSLSVATRYGNYAMEHLINDVLKAGGVRKNLEVKIVGGGRILAQMTDIGERNIAFVKDYLRVEGLTLAGEEVGDIYPRKVYYNPLTGKVRVKKLKAMHNNTIVERENAYIEELGQEAVAGEVELF